jgi:hypothetical protein
MRLEPLYTIRFFYPEGWSVDLAGKREQKRITSISQRDPAKAKSQGDFEDPIIRIDGPMRPTG